MESKGEHLYEDYEVLWIRLNMRNVHKKLTKKLNEKIKMSLWSDRSKY